MIDRRLLYVVSTARYGSFTAAANRVGVTQSAITKSIADLERQLGYLIFNRTARGVLLTDEGRNFVDRASHLLEETQDLFRGKSSNSDPYNCVLRIGVCPASLEPLLEEPLSTLIARHPDIRLHIVSGSYDMIVQQLRAGAIDVALGYEMAFDEQPDFAREKMAPLETQLFVRHGHPLLECEEITKTEVSKFELILPSIPFFYNFIWQAVYEEGGFDIHDKIHIIDYFPIVARLVRNTDFISVTSINYAGTRAFRQHFTAIPFPVMLQATPLCCATRLRWSPRPAVRSFIKACREQLLVPDAAQRG